MAEKEPQWHSVSIRLLALAERLEGEGQYNLAKLARAAAESLVRDAVFHTQIAGQEPAVGAALAQTIAALQELDVDAELIRALSAGANAREAGRLPLYEETPDPFVCRRCGFIVMESPQDPCPTCGSWPETFQRVPPVYWLEALDPFEALTALRETPQRVADMIAELPAPKVDEKPVEDAWSILNVVTHLRDAQGVLAYRVELLLEQEQPKIESQAVFEWASQGGTQTLEQIFESYQTSREATLEQLMTAPLPAWWRWGVHEEFGRVTIAQQASYFAMHEISHLPQLQNLLGA